MSYCRWSSDNFNCDLYCFADVRGGYTTYTAGNRVIGEIPQTDWRGFEAGRISAAEFAAQHAAQHDFLMSAVREEITLPHAGECFFDLDLASFLARLLLLREVGYRFPDYVIEEVSNELAAEKRVAP